MQNATMRVRTATPEDAPQILALYDNAHEVMRRSGNPTQWPEGYPGVADVDEDMARGALYVCVRGDEAQGAGTQGETAQGGEMLAAFFFAPGPDPTYAQIDGSWLNGEPYWVVHRIASREGTGAGRHCLAWACEKAGNVRIDTHEQNAPMRHVLKRLGFAECGTIICDNGTPRVAYHYALS